MSGGHLEDWRKCSWTQYGLLWCVSIDMSVRHWHRHGKHFSELELNSVAEMYLGRLSNGKILSYKWEYLYITL